MRLEWSTANGFEEGLLFVLSLVCLCRCPKEKDFLLLTSFLYVAQRAFGVMAKRCLCVEYDALLQVQCTVYSALLRRDALSNS